MPPSRRPARPALRFDRVAPLPLNTPVTEIQVEGAALDLRQLLQFVGISFGSEESAVTLGWGVTREVAVRREGQPATLAGLTLTVVGLTRFEVSLTAEALRKAQPETPAEGHGATAALAGALDYLEYRLDPEPSLLFFFEGGTIRLSGTALRGEVLVEPQSQFNIVQ
ncbi:MAG: hypothetical protein ACRD2E_09145 [Terriglobales bacterium]